MQLPWRAELLRGLLGADLVGFQRPRGRARTSLSCAAQLLGADGGADDRIEPCDGRTVRAGAFPISIDVGRDASALAGRPDVQARAEQIRARARRPATACCSASTGSTTPRASSTG